MANAQTHDTHELVAPDGRQVAKTLYFPGHLVEYINWEGIGRQRAELSCHMEVYANPHDHSLTITLFWQED